MRPSAPSPFSAPRRLHAKSFRNNAAMPCHAVPTTNAIAFSQTHPPALGNWSLLLLLLLLDGLQLGSSICAVKGVRVGIIPS